MILDTGPLVAIINALDKHHQPCLEFAKSFSSPLITTEAVVTEAMYLLSDRVSYQRTCADFLKNAEVKMVPSTLSSIEKAVTLMEKYADIPMDYADATLVVLAEESEVDSIFTLDRRGFETYRFYKNKHFKIYPDL